MLQSKVMKFFGPKGNEGYYIMRKFVINMDQLGLLGQWNQGKYKGAEV